MGRRGEDQGGRRGLRSHRPIGGRHHSGGVFCGFSIVGGGGGGFIPGKNAHFFVLAGILATTASSINLGNIGITSSTNQLVHLQLCIIDPTIALFLKYMLVVKLSEVSREPEN